MKKLKLTDILLLSIAGIFDVFQEFRDPGNLISDYYQNFYGFVPNRWKKQNYRYLVYKLIKDKKIIKIKKQNKSAYKLTKKGISHLEKHYLFVKLSKLNWNKKWTILLFDIEEVNKILRNRLRYHLKALGFGYLQKSVWISPYKVFPYLTGFIKKNKLDKNIILIETNKLNIKNEDILKRIWGLEKIEKNYKNIYSSMTDINKAIKNEQEIRFLKDKFNVTYKKLALQIMQDPYLPRELLPSNWPYDKTVKLAKRLRRFFLDDLSDDRTKKV